MPNLADICGAARCQQGVRAEIALLAAIANFRAQRRAAELLLCPPTHDRVDGRRHFLDGVADRGIGTGLRHRARGRLGRGGWARGFRGRFTWRPTAAAAVGCPDLECLDRPRDLVLLDAVQRRGHSYRDHLVWLRYGAWLDPDLLGS